MSRTYTSLFCRILRASAASSGRNRSLSRAGFVIACLAVAGISVPAGAASPQEQVERPVFGATVEVVQLQVMVGDDDGRFVPGLTREDFQLQVNGEPRSVSFVYEVDVHEGLSTADSLRPRSAGLSTGPVAQSAPPAAWRQFLLFFDLGFNSARGIKVAQESADEFMRESIRPDDLVAVASFSHVGAVQLLSPFTLDRTQTYEAIATLGLSQAGKVVDPVGFDLQNAYDELLGTGGGAPPGGGAGAQASGGEMMDTLEAMRRSDFQRYQGVTVSFVNQLGELGKMMQAARGRKHVILFSQGFDDKALTGQSLEELQRDSNLVQQNRLDLVDGETRFGSAEIRSALEKAIEELRDGDTVIHAFDTSELGGGTMGNGLQFLSFVSSETSGTLTFNTNDISGALADLEESTSAFYVVAYSREPGDPAVVDLELEVTRDGAEILSAPSRLAPPPDFADMDAAQRQMQLAEFLGKGIEQSGMSFEAEAIPFVGEGNVNRVATLIEIPWRQLEEIAEDRGDGRVEIEMLGYLLDDDDRILDFFARGTGLDLTELEATVRSGLPFRYYDLLWSRPGYYRVRVLLRESGSGRISTQTISVSVPDYVAGRPSLSGPVFVDRAHPGMLMRGIDADAPPERRIGGPVAYPFLLGGRELTPDVVPTVPRGQPVYFLLVAHHLDRHPMTGKVMSSVNAILVDAFGNTREVGDILVVGESYDEASDATTLLLEAHIPTAAREGASALRIQVTDGIAGVRLEHELGLVVAASDS
jgi:VWFA-related protein